MSWIKVQANNSIVLHLYVQPNARATEFCGIHNGLLKLKLSSPALEGKANMCLTAFLSDYFSVPKKSVHLTHGLTSRYKTVCVENISLTSANSFKEYIDNRFATLF